VRLGAVVSNQNSNEEWLAGLRARPPVESVVSDLHRALQRGLTRTLASRSDVGVADIEDFTQDAVSRVMNRLDSFRGESRFTTWATSIAIRLALTKMRRRAWGERSLDDLSFSPANEISDPEARDPVSRVGLEALLKALRNSIDLELSPRQRTVVLAKMAGMPSAVLADQLETNSNAIYKMHHDARKKLREALEVAGYSAANVSSLLAGASKSSNRFASGVPQPRKP
jgi:RNA polymerase sigma-70 factor (ECF subfamily)